METNKKNIPEIRFPEFMNDGEWLSAPLYELIKTITPTNKLQTSEYKPSGKYPIIDQSQNYIVAYSDSAEALTNTGCSDTIVFGDHTCALKFVNFPFIQGADGIKIFKSKDNNKILTDYLYQYLSAFPIESKEYKRHFSELKETLIKFPSDAIEQKRIAECMESLERYTIQTKVKLEQLKAHKKGLMQKLFPAPGKSVPECRFKEFENAGEWLSSSLNEIIETVTPARKLQVSEYKSYGKYPIIDQSQKYIVAYSDTIDALTNMECFDAIVFGDHTCALKFVNFPFIQGADGIKIFSSNDSNKVSTNYLYQYLSAFPIESKEYKRHFSALKEIVIKFPSDVIEQQKIADCLSSIDNVINLYSNKLDILERHKQALRQRLFPTI